MTLFEAISNMFCSWARQNDFFLDFAPMLLGGPTGRQPLLSTLGGAIGVFSLFFRLHCSAGPDPHPRDASLCGAAWQSSARFPDDNGGKGEGNTSPNNACVGGVLIFICKEYGFTPGLSAL